MASNVALRRQVFEKASGDASWRCSSDDKLKEDNDVKTSQTRSLSAESVKGPEKNNDKVNATIKKDRPKPVRENSYLTAVRSSPEVAPVVLRQKQEKQRILTEEEDRKTRRTSYLKATANEEFQFVGDQDQNSTSISPEDDEAQQSKR